MAQYTLGDPVSFKAAANLSSSQFCAVKISAADTVNLAGDGEDCIGVLQNKPGAAGRGAEVRTYGPTKGKAGGTCTAGGNAGIDSSGRFVNAASGDFIVGTFITGTTTANAIIKVFLRSKPSAL